SSRSSKSEPLKLGPLAGGLGAIAAGGLGYGWFEAGWVRLRERELRLPGVPSRGERATERAIDWVAERKPDLVCITGDLVSRARGTRRLTELLARLDDPFVVLGNHDYALSRDPFSQPVQLVGKLEHGRLLSDESSVLELRGVQVEIAGVDPRSWLSFRRSG